MRVRELAEWLGAPFDGDGEKEIAGAAALESAGASELAFIANRKAALAAASSAAGCLIVPLDYANSPVRTVIRADDPRTAFARAVSRLHPPPEVVEGIHPSAVSAPGVELGAGVAVGPLAVDVLGAGALLEPGRWSHAVLSTRANSIMGGTSEIQRNVIGERLLGLPREAK